MTNQLSCPLLSEVANKLSEARPGQEECRRGLGGGRWGRSMLVHTEWHTPCCTPRQVPPTTLVALGPVQVPHHQAVHLFLTLLLLLPRWPACLPSLVFYSRALLHAGAAVN